MAAKGEIDRIDLVQVDFNVVLKIIKHCEEEGSSLELVTGHLVGLVDIENRTLEVTNSFPLHSSDGEVDEQEAQKYVTEILKKFRSINVDYHQIGWYQSTHLGSHINKNFLENHFSYQYPSEEAVVLVYDPLATSRGMLSIKAYRISDVLMQPLKNETNFSPEMLQHNNIEHTDLFEEIPLVIKTSKLGTALLCELEGKANSFEKHEFLSLATSNVLQWNLKMLMTGVDNLYQDTARLVQYEKKQSSLRQQRQQFIQRRREENQKRIAKGEEPLPDAEEAVDKELNIKPIQHPNRLDSFLVMDQLDAFCQQLEKTASQGIGKMYLADCLQQNT